MLSTTFRRSRFGTHDVLEHDARQDGHAERPAMQPAHIELPHAVCMTGSRSTSRQPGHSSSLKESSDSRKMSVDQPPAAISVRARFICSSCEETRRARTDLGGPRPQARGAGGRCGPTSVSLLRRPRVLRKSARCRDEHCARIKPIQRRATCSYCFLWRRSTCRLSSKLPSV